MDTLRRNLLVLVLMLGAVPSYAQVSTTNFFTQTATTATWTSATARDTRLSVTTTNLTFVTVTVAGTGTIGSGQIIFEGYDGTNYFRVGATREDSGVVDSVPVQLGPFNQAWQVDTSAWQQMSIRLSTPIDGTGSIAIKMIPGAAPGQVTSQGNFAALFAQMFKANGQMPALAPPKFQLVGTFNRTIGSQNDAMKVFQVNSIDPCQSSLKGNVFISQTTNTRLMAGVPNKRFYICSFFVVGADSENLSLVEGVTGATVCNTTTIPIVGGTTAANGMNLAANSGFMLGNGQGTIATQLGAGFDICLFQSGAGRVAGNLTYVLQ